MVAHSVGKMVGVTVCSLVARKAGNLAVKMGVLMAALMDNDWAFDLAAALVLCYIIQFFFKKHNEQYGCCLPISGRRDGCLEGFRNGCLEG